MRTPLRRLDQAELDRVPVERRKVLQPPELHRPQAALAVGLHVVGEHRIGQQRHVAEHIVEDVRLLQVVELRARADELASGETAVGEVVEEHLVRHEARHGHDLEARARLQLDIDLGEVRNAAAVEVQRLQPAQHGGVSAVLQDVDLASIQEIPHGMFVSRIALPVLVDDMVIVARGCGTAHAGNVGRTGAFVTSRECARRLPARAGCGRPHLPAR